MDEIIRVALEEDLGEVGDITTRALFPTSREVRAAILCRDSGVIAGIEVATRVFALVGEVSFQSRVEEGERVEGGQIIAELEGSIKVILLGERTALNFLQHLSGVATLTAQFVKKVEGYPVKILDTRKTTPSLRLLEKEAVRAGGGFNHRLGLYDGVLIKDDHLKVLGEITAAVESARSCLPDNKIEVETENLRQAKEALEAGADVIMLDNMDVATMKEAVKIIGGRAIVEASGGINLENVREIAATGVDWISVGALTQAAPPLDISLEIVEAET